MRSKLWWGLEMREPRISTRFLSSRDPANTFVFIYRRATLRVFVDVARDLARSSGGAALQPYRTCIAVALQGTVEHRMFVV
jgi:hypothetical protein